MKLSLKPKTYLLLVVMRGFWPSHAGYSYHYANFEVASSHIVWFLKQIEAQNGEGAERKNVILEFGFIELISSKKRNKKFPPLESFVTPIDRNIPMGGISCLDYDADEIVGDRR